MLKLEYSGQFKKDYRTAVKRGFDTKELMLVIGLLAEEKPLPQKYKDHALVASRNYKNVRECHINPDWLLIYSTDRERLILTLLRTGTHSDLF